MTKFRTTMVHYNRLVSTERGRDRKNGGGGGEWNKNIWVRGLKWKMG